MSMTRIIHFLMLPCALLLQTISLPAYSQDAEAAETNLPNIVIIWGDDIG
jgi:hypothetical protein